MAEVMDPNITTISPVNKLHPRDDILASGSSRFVYEFIYVVFPFTFLQYNYITNCCFLSFFLLGL